MDIKIRSAGVKDLDTVVHFSYALFQEDAGQRDPFTNLNWPLEEGHAYFGPLLEADTHLCLIAEVNEKTGRLSNGLYEETVFIAAHHNRRA